MRKATRIVASVLGIFAAFGGPEHGYFEILQGNVRPPSLMFPSMGAPCVPEQIWHSCEPAITILPNLLLAGILASILGIVTMIWAGAFVHTKYGGPVLILLSVALLLTGGGVIPPIIGIIAGVVATQINVPLTGQRPNIVLRFFAKLWPWPLVIFLVWIFGQLLFGYLINEFLMESGLLFLVLIVGLLALIIVSGFARDVQSQAD